MLIKVLTRAVRVGSVDLVLEKLLYTLSKTF